jgi:hypothetical protein
LTLYKKLPNQKQILITAVANAKKQGNPTIDGIEVELNKLTNAPTDKTLLKEDLQEAEKVGLLKQALVNKEDKPAIEWRSLLSEKSKLMTLPIVSRFFK